MNSDQFPLASFVPVQAIYEKWSLVWISVHAYLWRLASHSERPAIQSAIQNVTTHTTSRRGQRSTLEIIFDILGTKMTIGQFGYERHDPTVYSLNFLSPSHLIFIHPTHMCWSFDRVSSVIEGDYISKRTSRRSSEVILGSRRQFGAPSISISNHMNTVNHNLLSVSDTIME